MKSIFKHFEELKDWDYYKRDQKKILDWNNNKEHHDFIDKYLDLSGKNEIKAIFKNLGIKFESFERVEHTNSVFFLGCLLYNNTILKNEINFYRPNNKVRDEFYFIWFLTSLTHDFGNQIEKNMIEKFNKLDNDIKSFKKHIKHYTNYYDLSEEIEENLVSNNMKILLNNMSKYYKCRIDGKLGRTEKKKIDHGIASGLILFNALKNIRIKKQKKLYQEYRMEDLILDNGKISKLSIKEDPFLFLFSIADTIEPIKSFDRVNNRFVLENIFVKFNDDEEI